MNIFYETLNGKIINQDNIEALREIEDNSIDSCVSDFPYNIQFMNKDWDSLGEKKDFYLWCFIRANQLYRILKSGSYAAIFGSVKTNHRMKCAFEDAGFIIVEEIDWLYLSGMPHNQDIGKMYERLNDFENAKIYNDWKTAGLKPAHETITIFQKPLCGTYTDNISLNGCGAMNIGACRVPISKEDIEMINAKSSKNPTTNYSDREDKIYSKFAKDIAVPANEGGRFPPNIVLSDNITDIVDNQTGISKSSGGSGEASTKSRARHIYGAYNQETNENYKNNSLGGYGDVGGGSRLFPIFKYCPKVSPKERSLQNGKRNPHTTLKPKDLIKWLIKLITPKNGITIDITAGSCTHAVCCEELNREENYKLKYIDIEICNDEQNPYCDVGKQRIEEIINSVYKKKLF